MSRRAYQARRAERLHRARTNNGAGLAFGECLACDQRRPLISRTGLCQACTTHEDDLLRHMPSAQAMIPHSAPTPP